ncbi:MAG: DNA replication/repair protein RecF [Clostridiales bacterium]|nr:DNA replication/repair protein RecF [Clostridiales bacterium]
MRLRELGLINYRNYIKLELAFSSNLIIFSGKNAQGKTNILESIFLSSIGRSHRTSRDREIILKGEKESRVRALVEKKEGLSLIEIALAQNENKKISINGMAADRLGELMGHINSVLFSPEDLRLVKGSPTERRRFIDMGISQTFPRYFYSLQRYNKILGHRNNLLKSIGEKDSLRKTLSVWDEQLSETGAYIISRRLKFIEDLKIIAKRTHREISFDEEELDISYIPSIEIDSDNTEAIMKEYMKTLETNHNDDIRRGRTEKGCHRDDLNIFINGMDVRNFGSQGQQRTSVLSLKLSEIEMMHKETGEYPLLLLDDVMSELDQYRQGELISYFDKVQTFITTTDYGNLPHIKDKNAEIYIVNKGKVDKA